MSRLIRLMSRGLSRRSVPRMKSCPCSRSTVSGTPLQASCWPVRLTTRCCPRPFIDQHHGGRLLRPDREHRTAGRGGAANLLAHKLHTSEVVSTDVVISQNMQYASDKHFHLSGWPDLNRRPLDPQTSAACPRTSSDVQFPQKIWTLHLAGFRWTNPNGCQNGGQTHSH